jgi:hypothetical protein
MTPNIYGLSKKQVEQISLQDKIKSDTLWEKYCKNTKDELSLFLKCHLLIEKSIDEILTLRLPNPKLLLEKSSFSQKITLLETLNIMFDQNIYKKLKTINRLRNYYVHYLSKDFSKKELQKIVKGLGIDTKVLNFNSILKVLRELLGYLDATKTLISLFPFLLLSVSNNDLIKKDKCFELCKPIIHKIYPEVLEILDNLKIK